MLALILFNNIYKLQIDMVERLIFNKPLPKELIIHIYSFDPTYKEYYNKCIDEINEAITYQKQTIHNLSKMFWDDNIPNSVYDWHLENSNLFRKQFLH